MPLLAPKINETRKLYPDWLNDDDLRDGETDTISSSEEQFWIDLIEKYLKPYDMNEDSKVCHQYKNINFTLFTDSANFLL
jgi:hypothetical protein